MDPVVAWYFSRRMQAVGISSIQRIRGGRDFNLPQPWKLTKIIALFGYGGLPIICNSNRPSGRALPIAVSLPFPS